MSPETILELDQLKTFEKRKKQFPKFLEVKEPFVVHKFRKICVYKFQKSVSSEVLSDLSVA